MLFFVLYRYCYSGLRKKLKLAPPSVPDLQREKENSSVSDSVTCFPYKKVVKFVVFTKTLLFRLILKRMKENCFIYQCSYFLKYCYCYASIHLKHK